LDEHNGKCDHTAIFSTMNTLGIVNLLMTCEECDYMYIVV